MTYPQQMPPPVPQGYPPPDGRDQRPQRKALGITASVVGGLAGLGALVMGVWIGTVWTISVIDEGPSEFEAYEGIAAFVAAFGGIFLLIGAGLHAKRKNAGRVMLAIGAVPALAFALLPPFGIALAALPLVAVVLAFLSRSWCLPKQQFPMHYPGYPPGQYGYGSYQQAPQNPPGYSQHPQQWQ